MGQGTPHVKPEAAGESGFTNQNNVAGSNVSNKKFDLKNSGFARKGTPANKAESFKNFRRDKEGFLFIRKIMAALIGMKLQPW